MADLRSLYRIADECDLTQFVWAKGASMNPSRLNMALKGHIALREEELAALEKSLRSYISERTQRFNEIITSKPLAIA